MKRTAVLSAVGLFLCVTCVWAVELVGVHGSNTQYTSTMDITIGDKAYHLVLTGTALRQKFFSTSTPSAATFSKVPLYILLKNWLRSTNPSNSIWSWSATWPVATLPRRF